MSSEPVSPTPDELDRAIEANGLAFWENFCSRPGMEFHREPNLVWFASGYAAATLNGVLWAELSGDDLDGAIDEVSDRFRRRRLPMEWRIGPASRPPELGDRLVRRGFSLAEDIPALCFDLSAPLAPAPPPGEFRVRAVREQRHLDDWFQAWVQGFEVPPFFASAFQDAYRHLGFSDHHPLQNLVGYLDGTPVATATVFLAAGVAGLHSITTVPRYRRRGLASAMTRAGLRLAREMGLAVAALHATPMALGLYQRLGFRRCGRQRIYLAPA